MMGVTQDMALDRKEGEGGQDQPLGNREKAIKVSMRIHHDRGMCSIQSHDLNYFKSVNLT